MFYPMFLDLRLSLGSLKEKSKEEMEAVILNAGPAKNPPKQYGIRTKLLFTGKSD